MRAAGRALAALLILAGPAAAEARLVGVLDLEHPHPDFGGLSAIEVGADGRAVVMLSDRSLLVRGVIARDAAGTPAGVSLEVARLGHVSGRPMGRADSEGLAIRADGRAFVAFEGNRPRVWSWTGALDAAAAQLPPPPGRGRLTRNEGLEALAATPEGVLAISEKAVGGGHPVLLWTGRAWRSLPPLAADGRWAPVGADWGPDGALWLLERRFGGLAFASRVRRFSLSPGGLGGGEVVLQTPGGRHGNLEGLAAWRAPSGRVRLTMVSDDNFFSFQRGEIVEYEVGP